MSVFGFTIDWWNIAIALFYAGSLYFSENYAYESALRRGIDTKDADKSFYKRLIKTFIMDAIVFAVLANGFYESKYPYVPVGYVMLMSILYLGGTLMLRKYEDNDADSDDGSKIKK